MRRIGPVLLGFLLAIVLIVIGGSESMYPRRFGWAPLRSLRADRYSERSERDRRVEIAALGGDTRPRDEDGI